MSTTRRYYGTFPDDENPEPGQLIVRPRVTWRIVTARPLVGSERNEWNFTVETVERPDPLPEFYWLPNDHDDDPGEGEPVPLRARQRRPGGGGSAPRA